MSVCLRTMTRRRIEGVEMKLLGTLSWKVKPSQCRCDHIPRLKMHYFLSRPVYSVLLGINMTIYRRSYLYSECGLFWTKWGRLLIALVFSPMKSKSRSCVIVLDEKYLDPTSLSSWSSGRLGRARSVKCVCRSESFISIIGHQTAGSCSNVVLWTTLFYL